MHQELGSSQMNESPRGRSSSERAMTTLLLIVAIGAIAGCTAERESAAAGEAAVAEADARREAERLQEAERIQEVERIHEAQRLEEAERLREAEEADEAERLRAVAAAERAAATTSLRTQLKETPERKLWKVRDTLRLDVISMWDLEDRFSTDLERSVYRDSKEHEIRLKELQARREELLQSKVAMHAKLIVSEYDVERGSLYLVSSAAMSTGSGDSHCVLSGQSTEVCFPDVAFEQESTSYFGHVTEEMVLEIQVPREQALRIERQRESLRVYLVFRPAEIRKISLDTGMGMSLVGPRLVADQVEVLLVDGDKILLREGV